MLPRSVRPIIGLAYLLARTSDTIADSGRIPVPQRLEALARLRERILGRRVEPCNLSDLADALPDGTPTAERQLLFQVEEAVGCLVRQAPDDRDEIRRVLDIITGGQELDLKRFGDRPGEIRCLNSEAELDDYTYRVAGCVGEFWTRVTRRRCFPAAVMDDRLFLEDGIRLGRGLQLVNILRDLPRDLRNGRCYLPASDLQGAGLTPGDLLDPAAEPALRPIHQAWCVRALGHLEAGWRYTNTLPRSRYRLRLACAWPVLLGIRTLRRLRAGPILDPEQRIKVPRPEVRAVLLGSLWKLPSLKAWKAQWEDGVR